MMKRLVSETVQEKAYRAIKESIVRNELLPGDSLSIEDLAQRLGVSQTPVREALGRLSAEGLVERAPNRTAVVSTIALQDIHQAYQVRKLLEPYAAKAVSESLETHPTIKRSLMELKDVASGVQKALGAAGNSLDQSVYEACQDIDLQLHELMVEALGESLYGRTLSLVGNYSLRMRSLAVLGLHAEDPDTLEAIVEQHLEMIDGLLAGDEDEIVATITHHLTSAERRTIEAAKKVEDGVHPGDAWARNLESVRSQMTAQAEGS
jgi:DNA-binding GntR family transcriptional regulator